MTEVIELSSDSDDGESIDDCISSKKVENQAVKTFLERRPVHQMSDDDDDFDFPEVPFTARTSNRLKAVENVRNDYSPPKSIINSEHNFEDILLDKYSSDNVASKVISKKQSPTRKAKTSSNHDKEQSKANNLQSREEALKQKTERAAIAERLKLLKPGECMKYMETTLDLTMTKFPFFGNLIVQLQTSGLNYNLGSQIVPNTITWARRLPDNGNSADENNAACRNTTENHVVLIWDCSETVEQIANGTFAATIASNQELLKDKSITLVIYGIEDYFRYRKNLKTSEWKNGKKTSNRKAKNSHQRIFDDLPAVSRKQLELCLSEVQITAGCNSRLIETAEELSLLIGQYTKALAEAPFKIAKRQIVENDETDWYVVGDNKDVVRVDKDGNGLKRLWQQQLCQFSLVKLETAEAIIGQFPSLSRLMEAYENCTPSEGEKLLQDITIRRAAGPLTAIRKIGPELSKKIHLMFTSKDGETLLGND